MNMNALSPQITTAVLVLGTVQLSRLLDLENPTTINLVRLAYVASQLLVLGVLYLIKTRIDGSENRTTVEVDTATPSFTNPNPSGEKKEDVSKRI